jgi:hypothetical protein
MLQHEAGLKALAGTADVRELKRRRDAVAGLALDLFCYRIQKCVGAYLAALEGAEASDSRIRWPRQAEEVVEQLLRPSERWTTAKKDGRLAPKSA